MYKSKLSKFIDKVLDVAFLCLCLCAMFLTVTLTGAVSYIIVKGVLDGSFQ